MPEHWKRPAVVDFESFWYLQGGEGGSNKKVERFDTFSVRFLNSFFLLKLFPDMCYLLLPRYHPHFFPNYRGAGRDQFKSWEFWRFFRCVFLTPFFFLSCFPVCAVCFSLPTTRIFPKLPGSREWPIEELRVLTLFRWVFLTPFFFLTCFPVSVICYSWPTTRNFR